MKYTILAILLFFFLGLTSCLPTKTVTESKTVTPEISDLSGKWNINDGGDYIIFEDATKKMVMKM